MIDLSLQNVSDGLHVALGALFVLVPVAISLHHPFGHPRVLGSVVGVLWATIKEFYIDPTYEDVATSGGPAGDVRDFLGYVLGIGVGLLILL